MQLERQHNVGVTRGVWSLLEGVAEDHEPDDGVGP